VAAAAVETVAAIPEATMIFRSRLPGINVPSHIPLHEYCFAKAASAPDATCLIAAATGRTYRFAETHLMCCTALVSHTGTFMVLLQNSVEFALAFFNASMLGVLSTTANPFCTPQEIHKKLVASGARLLVTQAAYVDKLRHEAFPRIGTGGDNSGSEAFSPSL
jgi:4-coumarate--CoA ligase